MGFFEDKRYQLIEELGREGGGGHAMVETGEEKGGNFKTTPDELDDEIEESLSSDGSFLSSAPPGLGRAVGRRGASRWWRANRFFNDLEDYWIERKGAVEQSFWGKMEKLEFQRKMIQKNGSQFHYKPLSWEGVG